MRAIDVEHAVVVLLNPRTHVIVPNVYWGLGLLHEADLLALDTNGRFTEIEIKVSKSDLKADLKKGHNHRSSIISRLVYAMPKVMIETAKQILPSNTGLISIGLTDYKEGVLTTPKASWVRIPKHGNQRPTDKQIRDFMRLGCMRIWSLKSHYYRNQYRQRKITLQ